MTYSREHSPCRSRLPVPALVAAVSLLCAPAQAARIKFATLAPDGTEAMKVMRAIDEEVREKTGGEVRFKFYTGGRQGDEKDMVRKIRVGQLHAGGFTGVGLGEIAPEVRILDAPWLFRSHEEVDHIYEKFAGDFEKAFEEKGYVLLGWSEVGFVHVFSNSPVTSAEDMKGLKLWIWEGDPIAEAACQVLGLHPIPLSITDVNTSLQTGLIDAVYSAPLYAIALQWHEKTKYVYSVPFANAAGAALISKSRYDRLSEEHQEVLVEVSRRHLRRLSQLTREENRKAMKTLEKEGLKLTRPASEKQALAYEDAGRKARRLLVGRLYSEELLDRVEKSLESFRRKRSDSSKKQ
ncbi:MAG: TRAP transporter substrate-binding protein DctP [Elusimicrobiota bacterium]